MRRELLRLLDGCSLIVFGVPRRCAWMVFLGATAVTGGAWATPATPKQKTPIFVFEAHTGERPGEIAPLVETLDDELEKRGFAARSATILQAAPGLPRPGRLDKAMSTELISQQVEKGYDLFTKAKYREAIAVLSQATEAIRRNPALIVLNTSNVDLIQKAHMTLALSQAYAGEPSASVTMMQEIRMFPTRPFPKGDYGPTDETYYRKIYRQVQTLGRGRLSITAGEKQAVIFVDCQIRGVEQVVLSGLTPGTYQVFIQVPGNPGRQYEVEVNANDDSFLNVEPEIDASLFATDTSISFQFASNHAREQEAKFAGHFATKWSNRDLVGVIGTRRREGRLILTGTIYTTDGTLLRAMALDVQTATSASLRELARLMAEGGVPSDGVTLIGDGTLAAEPRDDTKRGQWWSQPYPYLIGGSAVMLASTAFYWGTPADDYTQPTYDDYRSPAVLTFMAGSLVLGGGVYLWLRSERATSVLTAATIGVGVSAAFSGLMLYATDEDLHTEGFQRPQYRDTATSGVVLGGAGVAATGIGMILLMRDRRLSIVPTAAASDHHAMVSISGSF
jgi:hypothetical protein